MADMAYGTTGSMAKDKIDHGSEQLKGLIDAGAERLADVKNTVKSKFGDVKDRVIDGKDVVVDRAGSAADMLASQIKAHPFLAIGIALGVGYLAMRLIRR